MGRGEEVTLVLGDVEGKGPRLVLGLAVVDKLGLGEVEIVEGRDSVGERDADVEEEWEEEVEGVRDADVVEEREEEGEEVETREKISVEAGDFVPHSD